MNIFQTIQICNDIKKLHRTKGIERIYSNLPLYRSNWYKIKVLNDGTTIESGRTKKHISSDRFVRTNLFTLLFNTAGNYAVEPVTFTVIFNNNGLLPHAPTGENYRIRGLPARVIYNKMRREFKLAKKFKQKNR